MTRVKHTWWNEHIMLRCTHWLLVHWHLLQCARTLNLTCIKWIALQVYLLKHFLLETHGKTKLRLSNLTRISKYILDLIPSVAGSVVGKGFFVVELSVEGGKERTRSTNEEKTRISTKGKPRGVGGGIGQKGQESTSIAALWLEPRNLCVQYSTAAPGQPFRRALWKNILIPGSFKSYCERSWLRSAATRRKRDRQMGKGEKGRERRRVQRGESEPRTFSRRWKWLRRKIWQQTSRRCGHVGVTGRSASSLVTAGSGGKQIVLFPNQLSVFLLQATNDRVNRILRELCFGWYFARWQRNRESWYIRGIRMRGVEWVIRWKVISSWNYKFLTWVW